MQEISTMSRNLGSQKNYLHFHKSDLSDFKEQDFNSTFFPDDTFTFAF